MRLNYQFISYTYLTMASRYIMIPRTCSLVVQPLRTFPLVVQPLWTSSPVIQHVWFMQLNLSARNNSKVWAWNIITSPLVSSHESIIYMNLPTHINHAFHHQSRTYPLVIMLSMSWPKVVNLKTCKTHNKSILTLCAIVWRNLSATKRQYNADRLTVTTHCRALISQRLP